MKTSPLFRPTEFIHGADYNPEQWAKFPGIWDTDMRLLNEANLNSVSLGIFSWAELEPEEGIYRFEWMDEIINRLEANGQKFFLATPSGAKPNWMALKYPEIRRVGEDGHRRLQGLRHNHCLTSPIYRKKVREMNTLLAKRYGHRRHLLAWHISNEYGGNCYCDLCKADFRLWLKERYQTLEGLNDAWWSRFWSHTYTDWAQIDRIDEGIHAMLVDWRRFMTAQVATFIRNEAAPLREISPQVPTTINMMGGYDQYDYNALAKEIDFISWDSYPVWHGQAGEVTPHWHNGMWTTFYHDQFRSMKPDEPMLLIETTPSQVNWAGASPLKRPGMHRTACLLAVSRGSEGVCYFQFRSSQGSSEKYHGTVVSHDGRNDTRVFRDVQDLGTLFQKIQPVIGSLPKSQVAVLHDFQNRWAIHHMQFVVNQAKNYVGTCVDHYAPFWARGIGMDVPDQSVDFSRYRIVVAPMLHMLLPGTAERLIAYVENGGILVTTYMTGYVNESDLCFLGGFPGPLRELLGVRIEETDALPAFRKVFVSGVAGNSLKLSGQWEARDVCEILHAESAEVLATYASEFYAGTPALTRKATGKGVAYHLGARMDASFLDTFTAAILSEAGIAPLLGGTLPLGVTAQTRIDPEGKTWMFLMNFNETNATVSLGDGKWQDVEANSPLNENIELPAFSTRIFFRER